eukprot:6203539-Pleurochrysis_carterae.AAC.3
MSDGGACLGGSNDEGAGGKREGESGCVRVHGGRADVVRRIDWAKSARFRCVGSTTGRTGPSRRRLGRVSLHNSTAQDDQGAVLSSGQLRR